jgi:hypothetical protein
MLPLSTNKSFVDIIMPSAALLAARPPDVQETLASEILVSQQL